MIPSIPEVPSKPFKLTSTHGSLPFVEAGVYNCFVNVGGPPTMFVYIFVLLGFKRPARTHCGSACHSVSPKIPLLPQYPLGIKT